MNTTHAYLYLSDRIEHLIYNFPALVSSLSFRMGAFFRWFSG